MVYCLADICFICTSFYDRVYPKILAVYIICLFKFIGTPVLGTAAGYSVLETVSVTVLGLMSSVIVFTNWRIYSHECFWGNGAKNIYLYAYKWSYMDHIFYPYYRLKKSSPVFSSEILFRKLFIW